MVSIDDWIQVLPTSWMAIFHHASRLVEGAAPHEGDQPGVHYLADEHHLQRIHAVLTTEMEAAARHLLGKYRALQH